MRRNSLAVAAAALIIAASPALAQGATDGASFVEALRARDDSKAFELVSASPRVVNARDGKGETPLLVAIGRRDEQWTGYLLNNDADPNLAANNGDTPLMAASRLGFDSAVEWLLSMGAKVDAANRMGETALIVAVQQRQVPAVQRLLEAGADPDKADSAAGYTARDYAKRDTRTPKLLRTIEAAKPAGR